MTTRKEFKGPYGWTLKAVTVPKYKEIWIASGQDRHYGPSLSLKEVDKLIKWLTKQREKMTSEDS